MAIAVVVDDNEEELKHSLSILKNVGKFEQIYGFNCPEDAYYLIMKIGCDVLFTEVEMRGMNGFVLMSKLRKIKKDISFIITTSNEDYAYEAFQKGVIDYVLKPLSPVVVAKTLVKLKKFDRSRVFGC